MELGGFGLSWVEVDRVGWRVVHGLAISVYSVRNEHSTVERGCSYCFSAFIVALG